MAKMKSKATRQANAQRAAERAAALRKEQERKDRRRRTVVVTAVAVAVLALVVVIAAVVQSARDTTGETATPPQGIVDEYALVRGDSDAPVTVEVYEDFMCPFCGQFEAAAGPTLAEYADAGDAQVEYHMVAWLDRYSNGTDYSTRAMNAVAVVLDEAGRETALEFHDLLFAHQPAEGTDGLTDEELVDLAVEAGADRAAVASGIETLAFEQWVKNASDQASQDGLNQTPTVVVDGEVVEFSTIDELLGKVRTAVDSAQEG